MHKTCFVVQPLHNRADEVLEKYIEPALRDNFKLHEPGKDVTSSITGDIFNYLKNDQLVLCFLSAPVRVPAEGNVWAWNPNVMLEAGYRLGLGKPIVFVREKKIQQDEPMMPFDLYDHMAIELLLPVSESPRENRISVINRIREAALKAVEGSDGDPEDHIYPGATMSFGPGGGRIVQASKDAAEFYRYPAGTNLVGIDVSDMVNQLTSQIAPSQRVAFQAEQKSLIGDLFLGLKPTASVCIVFGKESIKPGAKVDNAYLPIVTSFKAADGEPTILKVIYLSVRGAASVGADGVVRCYFDFQNAAA